MNERDEMVRGKLIDRLVAVGVDPRLVTVEVSGGEATVRGAVPSAEQRERAFEALAGAHAIELIEWNVPPSDSAHGRGRSPRTGTSAHQTRHQTDPT